jgi:hypothetical protein
MNESALQLWHGVLFRQRSDLAFESISAHVEEWTGLEPKRALEAVHPADRTKVEEAQTRFRLQHAHTSRITWVEQRRRAIAGGYEGYWEDVTERIELARELAQSQWKAILGTATQRLVHDFNNLLTGVLSVSDAYLLRLKEENPAREGLQVINQNARQAADIVQQIGALFRETPGRQSYQNLCDIAKAAADILGRVLPKYSVVNVDLKTDSAAVYVDATELKQVIVSLALALQPPINIEVHLEHKEALLKISGAKAEHSGAVLVAEAFAEKNAVNFAAGRNGYTLRFPEADFSEADKV